LVEHALLDYLVRPQQKRVRDRQAKRLGGLEVDHQLELRGPFDREFRRLGALQDSVDVAGRALPSIDPLTGSVGQETPCPGHKLHSRFGGGRA
jgi:hypothetical protein